jgi:hypothetical protein
MGCHEAKISSTNQKSSNSHPPSEPSERPEL